MYVLGGGMMVKDSVEFRLNISPCYDEEIVFDVIVYSVSC